MARTRRRTVARRNPPENDWVKPVALIAGVGAVIYLATRPSAAQAAEAVTVPVPPGVVPPAQHPPSVLLVDRLNTSQMARRLFWLQASFYSAGMAEDRPDGVGGPATTQLVTRVNAVSGTPGTAVDAAFIRRAAGVLAAPSAVPARYRLIPNWLPQATVNAINATIRADAPNALQLQVRAL